MTGDQANGQNVAYGAVASAVSNIFGAIGANKYVQNNRFKSDDVVIEETARDNRALVVSGATVLLFVVAIIILWKN